MLTPSHKSKMKKRAHELAKELGVSSKQILSVAKGMGMDIKTASSSIEVSDAEKIRKSLSSPSSGEPEDREPAKKEVKVVESDSGHITETRYSSGRVTRRRKKEEKPPRRRESGGNVP